LGERAIPLTQAELDLSKIDTIRETLDRYSPDVVINPAAYTAVDKAEEEQGLASLINGEAPGVMAAWCNDKRIPFIHYSTDYVFDGSGDHPRDENMKTAPLNHYGASKLAGEQAVEQAGGNYLIFRTSWVYDAQGKNFVNTMLRLGGEREVLSIVADQIGAPSYAPHLADATLQALEKVQNLDAFPSGVYHMCNAGETSWNQFALAIFEGAKRHGRVLEITKVNAINTVDYPTPATRPLNSRLDYSRLKQVFDITMPSWQEGLEACLQEKFGE
jgi:dTDP-4-dehydrorhamnose reductase